MHPKTAAVWVATGALVIGAMATGDARPNRYGHSDREERHLMPAVSSGPLDPSWSPDGKWIAVSMRGDIWKVPADGGEAIAFLLLESLRHLVKRNKVVALLLQIAEQRVQEVRRDA